ncbi:glutaredoxin family protein [Alteromonas oceanisediminis]|uniref:glutaredoxin family protein n=1 Tax=Alteromonas oceanisediminis TaxID=2836180 RepID=UPI001BD91A42|nr:glutaredoxin family protein [Alteromonas oceanisediminis]MBT0587112.1 glutaredoxin family protein [Alteromonas oceanisediminis]
MKIILFSGPQCHLCDNALEELGKVTQPLDIEVRNIRDNAQDYHQYALRIPVLLRQDTQQELGWPFNVDQIEQFIQ